MLMHALRRQLRERTQCTKTEGEPYERGADTQPTTIHGEHADDARGTSVVGGALEKHTRYSSI
jgi:hypothetical protein